MDLAAEYNNRALVPEHPAIIARWQQDAQAWREATHHEPDIAYGARPRNRLDFFPASGRGPIVLFIHGGYWRSLDKAYFSHVARGPNARGLDVAVAGYTLCPEVGVLDIIDELRQCCLFLHQRYGRPLLVAGHSAGGHLAAAMAATDWQAYGQPTGLIKAGLSISGLFDLRPLMATPINDDLRLSAATALAASPLLWPMPNRLSFDNWVGALESREFLRQARSLAAAWQGLGLNCAYAELEQANHFTIGDRLCQPDHPITRRLAALAGES
jgi:arylformamidase